jgi:nickel transport protein
MKSLMRWGAVLGLVGSALLGSTLSGNMQALALPEEQILQKLKSVPVFAITDAQGAPLIASRTNQGKQTLETGVFINQQDAQEFVEKLKTKNPQLAQSVKVVPVSLAEVYKMDRANEGKAEDVNFTYVPWKQQVDSAMALLRQQGQQVNQFNGVPMFMATGGPENGYLTIQRGNEQAIPVFFNKEDLQAMLDSFKQQQPDLAAKVQIKVVNLEGVIDTLQKSNDQELNLIVLVPPSETIKFLRNRQPAQIQNPSQPKP